VRGKEDPNAILAGLGPGIPRRTDTTADRFWALEDVSFEVPRGEVLGIIGRNGAGKSTLLKILSRVTTPTNGEIKLKGRVASLLEVGTGFHQELTGRENIFLNGAILGMRKEEIQRKFDQIVAFAEVEQFIDTPVKRYSSGMYVRLAFAVAAHLDPEILVIDEVLAVGDAQFQAKCLGKIEEQREGGRTILFVSHNMSSIKRLCPRVILLRDGRVHMDAPSEVAIQAYLNTVNVTSLASGQELSFTNPSANPDIPFEVERIDILDERDHIKTSLSTCDYARLRITWRSDIDVARGEVLLGVRTQQDVPLLLCTTRSLPCTNFPFRKGTNVIELEFGSLPLASGRYLLSVSLVRPSVEFLYHNESFGVLEIHERDVFESGLPLKSDLAVLAVPHRWIT
jgi:lipopolysaccharide transport system ATP-binding protein